MAAAPIIPVASTLTVMIDTAEGVASFVDELFAIETSALTLFVDIEGVDLSRLGSISLIQILARGVEKVFLVDVHTLGKRAFSSPGSNGWTLRAVFESDVISKYFFDVRNDSDALFSLFDIHVDGVRDIQLLELATRRGAKLHLRGLGECIAKDCLLSPELKRAWLSVKEDTVSRFDPTQGGSYEIFNDRPLSPTVEQYCVQDVQLLPNLAQVYESRINSSWRKKVHVETKRRLQESRLSSYNPHGKDKIYGPKHWTQDASNKSAAEGVMANDKQIEAEFKEWSFKFPRTAQEQRRATTLTSPQLSALMEEALRISKSSDDGLRRVAQLLASKGGSIRVSEILDQPIATLYEVSNRQLLPFLEIICALSTKSSAVFSSSRTILLERLYGLNGERAVRAFGAMTRLSVSNAKDRTQHVELTMMAFVDTLVTNNVTALIAPLEKTAKDLLELTLGLDLSDEIAESAEKLRSIPAADHSSVDHGIGRHQQNLIKCWSMFPDRHDEVMQLLESDNVTFKFHPIDDDLGHVLYHDTSAMGRFICHNKQCSSHAWTSKKISMTIRLYTGNRYNARVYYQHCKSCESVSKPRLDASYAERVAFRLKRWSGVPVDAPHYLKESKAPHQSDLCEGCKAGHCSSS